MAASKRRVLRKGKQVKNKKSLIIFTAVVAVLGIAVFCWWFFFGRFEDFTRDAYVNGNQVRLTAQVSGYVSAVYCNETQLVKEGQVLVSLDRTDKEIAFNSSLASLGSAVRSVTKMFEDVGTLAAAVKTHEALLIKAEIDFHDREAVIASGAVSMEDFINAKTTFESEMNALEGARFDLRKAISLVTNTTVRTHPHVKAAMETVKHAYVNLNRCDIKAPATGIIAQRSVQVGESITTATPLLAIVPLDQIWVNANFKEIHMKDIRIGQEVSMTSDCYGGSVVYRGIVLGIAGGTGAVFSALPPQNATGNWIKIVQRVPVRISIPEQMLMKYPLRLGLSMNVTVSIKDTEGLKVPEPINAKLPRWKTDVFKEQEEGVCAIIEKVLQANESFTGMISEEVRLLGTKRR